MRTPAAPALARREWWTALLRFSNAACNLQSDRQSALLCRRQVLVCLMLGSHLKRRNCRKCPAQRLENRLRAGFDGSFLLSQRLHSVCGRPGAHLHARVDAKRTKVLEKVSSLQRQQKIDRFQATTRQQQNTALHSRKGNLATPPRIDCKSSRGVRIKSNAAD